MTTGGDIMKTEAERKTILEAAIKEIQVIASKYNFTLDTEGGRGHVFITHHETGSENFGIRISVAPF